MRWLAGSALLLCAGASIAAAEPPPGFSTEPTRPSKPIGQLLAEWQADFDRGSADNIAMEDAILTSNGPADAAPLLRLVDHVQFGPLVLWTIANRPTAVRPADLIAAVRKLPHDRQIGCIMHIAAVDSADSKRWLSELSAWPEARRPEVRHLITAACILLGDKASLTATEQRLVRQAAPADIADALLILADARSPRLLPLLAPFLDDTRRLPAAIPAGMQGLQPATTVSEAALLAANRSTWTRCPPNTAVWLRPPGWEPRFGAGAPGMARLREELARTSER